MTRVNNRSEVLKAITEVGVFRDTTGGGSSTATSTMPTVGAKSVINAVSGTNFVAGDWFRVGSLLAKPQINRVDSIVTNAITPRFTWRHAVASGDAIVEQTQVPLKHLAGPVRWGFSGSHAAVQAEERELAVGYLTGILKAELSFEVLPVNLNNLLLTLGMRDADSSENIAGSGTSAAPHRVFVDGSKFRELGSLCWYVNAVTQGNRTLTMIFTGCEVNPAALKHGIQRGSRQAIPFRLVPTTGILLLEID